MDYNTCLTLLGVKSSATQKELQVAYRKCANLWHPDRFQQSSKAERAASEKRMREINTAYQLLLQYFTKHGHLPGYKMPFEDEPEMAHQREPENVYREHSETVRQKSETTEQTNTPVRKKSRKGGISAILLVLVFVYYVFFMPVSDDQRQGTFGISDMNTSQQRVDSNNAVLSDPQNPAPDKINDLAENKPKEEPQYLFSSKEKSAFDRSAFEKPPEDDEKIKTYFTYGDPPGKVYEVQGVPTKIDGDIWYYGKSEVHFSKGRVSFWTVIPPDELKAKRHSK